DALANQKIDPFVQELCYGVLRFYFQLDFFLSKLAKRSIKDTEIKALLLVGLYQLFFLEKAEHAVVSETVNATKDLKKVWAAPFVNGVLRSALRSREMFQNHFPVRPSLRGRPEVFSKGGRGNPVENLNLSTYFSHPDWLIEK